MIRQCIKGIGLSAALLILVTCTSFTQPVQVPQGPEITGVWWWYANPKENDTYLDFVEENGVTEIYYYTDNFNDRYTGPLIEKAHARGMKVYYLTSDVDYSKDSDYTRFKTYLDRKIGEYIAYQEKAPANRKFSGLHLDIEPQNRPNFNKNANKYVQDYIDFVVYIRETYPSSSVGTIDFDIASWFDEYTVTYRGTRKKLHEALITEADRVCIMAYRDTARRAYNETKEEVEVAKSLNKQILIGTETDEVTYEANVSYYGKGHAYLNEQLNILSDLLKNDYSNCALAMHYIEPWYDMAH